MGVRHRGGRGLLRGRVLYVLWSLLQILCRRILREDCRGFGDCKEAKGATGDVALFLVEGVEVSKSESESEIEV